MSSADKFAPMHCAISGIDSEFDEQEHRVNQKPTERPAVNDQSPKMRRQSVNDNQPQKMAADAHARPAFDIENENRESAGAPDHDHEVELLTLIEQISAAARVSKERHMAMNNDRVGPVFIAVLSAASAALVFLAYLYI